MTLNSKQFKSAVEFLMKLPGGTLPEAGMIRLGNGRLTRTTFDAHAEISLDGADDEILLSGEFLRRLDPAADTLEITTKDGQHLLSSGALKTKRPVILDHPLPVPVPTGAGVVVDLPSDAIRFCLAAASKEQSRSNLMGMILDGEGKNLFAVGTTGQFLHALDAGPSAYKDRVTIPSEHARLIPDGATLTVHENCVVVTAEGIRLILPVLETRPPGMRQVMPKEFDGFATVPKGDLQDAVGQFRQLHPDAFVELRFEKERLLMSVDDKTGRTEIEVPCKATHEHECKITSTILSASLPFCPETIIFSEMKGAPGLSVNHENKTILLLGSRVK